MATYTQYDSEGKQLAEDVEDTMWRDISPEETPVISMGSQGTSTQKLTEWLQIEKDAAGYNAQVEGDDSPAASGHTPTRLNNNQQIFEKTAQVSDSQEAAKNYGISSQMAKEMALKTVELRRDCELAIVGLGDAAGTGRLTGAVGAAGTARELKCVQSQISSDTTTTAAAVGSLLESDVLDNHKKIRIKGGGKDLFLVHSIAAALDVAQFVSPAGTEVSGRRRDLALETRLVNAIEVYKTPWGTLTSVQDDFIDPNSALLLDNEYIEMKYMQGFHSKPLAEGGFYTKRGLLVEMTPAVLNTFASGLIDNIIS
tara:strand:- start:1353 stop:2288 length:936 start_codon:yes stop_codon:yes gene_type:complete